MTHKHWQNLLPFYAAGTLSQPDHLALERHLATCAACRKTLDEWRSIAGIVRAEVDAWAQAAPPLAPQVRASLYSGGAPSSNGSRDHPPAWSLEQTLFRQKPAGSHAPTRRFHLPLTLTAAAAVILAFGGLLLFSASRGKPPSPLSQPGYVSPSPSRASGSTSLSPTPPVTVQPVRTLYPTPTRVGGTEPADLGILPAVPLTPTIVPLAIPLTPTLVIPSPGYVPPNAVATVITATVITSPPYPCNGTVVSSAPVMLYDRPNPASGISGALYPGTSFQVIGESDTGWYQIVTLDGYTAGRVPGDLVFLDTESCRTAPVPPALTPFPTLIYGESIGMGYMLITTEPIGDMPAGARVRISHARFDGSQWQYYVVAEDEQTMAWASASQLTYAPDVTPGPTPTALYGSSIGMGYALITTEQVGSIPAGTRVRIGSAWFDGTDWVDNIVTEDGQTTAEARQSQLAYAPPTTATSTPLFFTPTGG